MSTIFDVAKKAGVSVMTVSRTLNSPGKVSLKTRKKITRAMEALGYEPNQIARSLVKSKTHILGIIMPDIKNTFFNSWFREVEQVARSMGYNLLLCNTDEDVEHELQSVRLMLGQRVDGIVIVPHARESVLPIQRSQRPFILVDRFLDDIEADAVSTDHYAGAVEATEYLLSLGHRSIAVLRGPGILFPDVERYRGFADAMKKWEVPIDPRLVRNCEFQEAIAYQTTKDLLSRTPAPTAVFSFNSLMTIGVMKALSDLDLRIPDDLSIITYDQIPGYSIVTPTITYIQQPIEILGREATRIILQRIERKGSEEIVRTLIPPKLVVGTSCRDLVNDRMRGAHASSAELSMNSKVPHGTRTSNESAAPSAPHSSTENRHPPGH